jgi:hypothetical protein
LTENTAPASGGAAASRPANSGQAGPANGTYTFNPRPQVTKGGIGENGYILKVVVNGKNMLIYLTRVPRGIHDGRAAPFYWSFGGNDVLLTDLDNPAKMWNPVSHSDLNGPDDTGEVLSFENVTATRFSLEMNWEGLHIFEEILLGEPDQ